MEQKDKIDRKFDGFVASLVCLASFGYKLL